MDGVGSRGVETVPHRSGPSHREPDLRVLRARHGAEQIGGDHGHVVAARHELVTAARQGGGDAVDLRQPRVGHQRQMERRFIARGWSVPVWTVRGRQNTHAIGMASSSAHRARVG